MGVCSYRISFFACFSSFLCLSLALSFFFFPRRNWTTSSSILTTYCLSQNNNQTVCFTQFPPLPLLSCFPSEHVCSWKTHRMDWHTPGSRELSLFLIRNLPHTWKQYNFKESKCAQHLWECSRILYALQRSDMENTLQVLTMRAGDTQNGHWP